MEGTQIKLSKHPKKDSDKTFLSSLFPTILLCNIIGVWPITTVKLQNTIQAKISLSKSIHTGVIFLLQAIIPFIFTYKQSAKPDSSINVVIFEEVVNKYLYVILGCIFVLLTLIRANKMTKFCIFIYEIDLNIKFLCKSIDYSVKRKEILVNLIGGLILYITVVVASHLTAENSLEIIKSILFIIIFGVLINFSACVSLIKQRYELINDYLENFSQNKLKNNFGTVITPLDELKILSVTCGLLCDSSEVINEAYTIQLLCFVVLVFLGTLFGVFSTARIMMDEKLMGNSSLGSVALNKCSMNMFMVWILVLVIVRCSSTQNEVSLVVTPSRGYVGPPTSTSNIFFLLILNFVYLVRMNLQNKN